jgi:DNA polymerase-1
LIQRQDDLLAIANALDKSETVGIDVETSGLDPRKDRLRLLSLSTDRGTWLVDAFTVDIRPLFGLLAERTLIAHNASFDVGFLASLGFEPGRVRCTMVLSQLLYGTRKPRGFHTLAACAERELGRAIDKSEQTSDWSGELSAEQLAYAALDAEVLLALHAALEAKIQAANLSTTAEIESRCLPAMVWLARSGVPFDTAAWQTLAATAAAEAHEQARRLNAEAPPAPQRDLTGEGWNWDSPKQVKQALEAAAGCTLESTADEALAGLNHPLAELVRDYRAAKKKVSTYGADWLSHVSGDGRVYANWWQIGADSGRMSCRSPNMQQLPRGEYRRCVRAPAGRVLVKADYSQIELRIAAKVSGDQAMLAAFRDGLDLHTLTAIQLLGKGEVTKDDRQLAKSANFGLLYGMGARGYRQYARTQFGLDMTEAQAGRYRRAFFATYPGLGRWHRQVRWAHAAETRTLAGRRRLMDAKTPDTQRLNTPVQGTGADGLKQAMALLWQRRDQVPGAFPVLVVHDEIVVECDAGHAEAVSDWLKQAMLDGMAPFIEPVPVEVEVKIAPTWAGE